MTIIISNKNLQKKALIFIRTFIVFIIRNKLKIYFTTVASSSTFKVSKRVFTSRTVLDCFISLF